MSRKNSYENGDGLPENCGVDLSGDCNPYEDFLPMVPGNYYEYGGECEEGGEECLSKQFQRLGSTGRRASKQEGELGSRKTSLRSQHKKSIILGSEKDGKAVSAILTQEEQPTSVIPSIFPEIKDSLFKDMPQEYFKKKYRPDYPTDLQMKQVCKAKPLRRRTIGTTKTQPRAVFIPSDSSFLQDKDNTSGKRGSEKSSLLTSVTKGENWNIDLEEPSLLEQNRMPPPIVSSSDEVVVDWLEDHNVQMMFEYFLGLCVIYQPEDPWDFISQLAGKMIEARTDMQAFDSIPRILTPEHQEAIFRIYDRIENGFITVSQYKSAMEAMGLNRYSMNPEGWEENAISKDAFVKESTDAISDLLRSFMVFKEKPAEDLSASNDGNAAQMPNSRNSYSGTYTTSTSSDKSRTATGSDKNAEYVDDFALRFD